MNRATTFVWKVLAGTVLCMTPVTAVIVVGWTARAMQRAVIHVWHAENGTDADRVSFASFAGAAYETRRLAQWPNWFVAEDLRQRLGDSKAAGAGLLRRGFVIVFSLLDAFWLNLRAGVQTVFATWVATLPVMVLWLIAWWGGWENSFNKGYEQSWVGPLLAVIATVLFVMVMTCVPLSQARMAAAGRWRAFFDFGVIRTLAASRPVSMLKLVAYFVLAGAVVMLARSGPLAVGNLAGDAGWSEHQVLALKLVYDVFCSVLAFALFVALRLAAARAYARAMLAALKSGRLGADRLGDVERDRLASLNLLEPRTRRSGSIVVRAAVSTGRGVTRALIAVAVIMLWLVFVVEIFVAQFLNHDWVAWINHPLLQLPWISTFAPNAVP